MQGLHASACQSAEDKKRSLRQHVLPQHKTTPRRHPERTDAHGLAHGKEQMPVLIEMLCDSPCNLRDKMQSGWDDPQTLKVVRVHDESTCQPHAHLAAFQTCIA